MRISFTVALAVLMPGVATCYKVCAGPHCLVSAAQMVAESVKPAQPAPALAPTQSSWGPAVVTLAAVALCGAILGHRQRGATDRMTAQMASDRHVLLKHLNDFRGEARERECASLAREERLLTQLEASVNATRESGERLQEAAEREARLLECLRSLPDEVTNQVMERLDALPTTRGLSSGTLADSGSSFMLHFSDAARRGWPSRGTQSLAECSQDQLSELNSEIFDAASPGQSRAGSVHSDGSSRTPVDVQQLGWPQQQKSESVCDEVVQPSKGALRAEPEPATAAAAKGAATKVTAAATTSAKDDSPTTVAAAFPGSLPSVAEEEAAWTSVKNEWEPKSQTAVTSPSRADGPLSVRGAMVRAVSSPFILVSAPIRGLSTGTLRAMAATNAATSAMAAT